MRFARLLVVPFVLILAGCFEGQRTFKVNADGSGTIVDTAKLGAQASGMLQGLESMDKTTPAEKAAKKKMKYAEKAASMGEGVTYVSTVTKDGADVTTYAFKNINTLKASSMPTPDENSSSKDEPLTFKLAKNAAGNSVLTIVAAKPAAADAADKTAKPTQTPEAIKQQIGMMKGLLAGLKIRSVVEVNGKIVKTNSPYAVGPAVTLMELDFDALDEAALVKLSASGPGAAPTPAMLKGIKGIKMADPETTIEFSAK
jgi:hypothetical protein